jgi:8-oxo-dGTP diphosphatase
VHAIAAVVDNVVKVVGQGREPRKVSVGQKQQGDQTSQPHEKDVAAGVCVLIRRGDEVLLEKRAHSHGAGTWAPPGGYLRFGESFEHSASRETREESGVEIADVRFLAVTNDVFEQVGKAYVTIWMQAAYASGQATVKSPGELSEVGWSRWDALPTPRFLPLEHLLAGQRYPRGANESLP